MNIIPGSIWSLRQQWHSPSVMQITSRVGHPIGPAAQVEDIKLIDARHEDMFFVIAFIIDDKEFDHACLLLPDGTIGWLKAIAFHDIFVRIV